LAVYTSSAVVKVNVRFASSPQVLVSSTAD